MPGFAERFWTHVAQGESDDCWPWLLSRLPKGYGRVSRDGKILLAHRVAHELATGKPIPVGLNVLHSCDNPPCCNPAHLFAGTQQQNILDALAKGRMTGPPIRMPMSYYRLPRGERRPGAKLTPEKVIEIRGLSQTVGGRELARRFGVSHTTIRRIITRAVWAHV